MPKYRIDTDHGSYIVETADAPPPVADPNYVPDAAARLRSQNAAMVPPELRGYTPEELAQRTDTSNPLSPMQSVSKADQLNNPYRQGIEQASAGVAQMAQGNSRDVAGGASKIIRGAGNVVKVPALALTAGALATGLAPIGATAAGLGIGAGAQALTEGGLKSAGVPDEYSELAGDIAGLAGGAQAGEIAGAVKGLPGRAVNATANAAVRSLVRPQLDPTEAAAVAYGREQGIQMPLSVQTGSKLAANAEHIVQHVPFSSAVAKAGKVAGQEGIARAGAAEVQALAPGATGPVPEPLDVGEALHRTALQNEQAHNAAANDSYDIFRSIEQQPQFTTNVKVGMKRVDAGIDEDGNPTWKLVPDMQDVQLPVDYRPLKAAVKPLLEETLRPMSIAQEQSSRGIKAMRNILDAPDFVSASTADQDLGALKGIIRDSPQSRSVGQAKFAADRLSAAVDEAAERAGPDAVAALKQGRASTVSKYQAQDFQRDIGFKDVGTGNVTPGSAVDLVTNLVRPGDRSIALLRAVQQNAPEHIPALAQAVTQGLLDKVTAEAGQAKAGTALTEFNKLGEQTKRILFGDAADRFENFFTLAKRMNENVNPSGSGSVLATLKAGTLVLTQPHIGIPALIGSRALTRMLYNPESSTLLMRAMQMPANSGAAGAVLSKQILRAAGPDPGAGAPPQNDAGVSTTAAPVSQQSRGVPNGNTTDAGATGKVEALPGAPGAVSSAGSRAGAGGRSSDTTISVPGQPGPGYKGRYRFTELDDLQGSHNGNTFQPNPKFKLKNDRQYDDAVNQGKIVQGASRAEFDERQLVNNIPDATSGPLVHDSQLQVLSGNGRKALLDRLYAGNPEGVARYRALQEADAHLYGLDPAESRAMRKPVLTREIDESQLPDMAAKQRAITDFNKTSTAALTPGERAIADSRRVSSGTLDDMASRLDAQGDNATVSDILQGKSGGEILDKMVKDGVVSPQERAAFQTSDGELTPAGKDRISALMVGRFFRDPAQMESIAPTVRNQVERIAAPLAQVEAKPDWSLTPDLKQALTILEQAQKLKIKSVDDFIAQDGLFGKQKYSEKQIALANALKGMSAKELKASARQYASDANYASKGANTLLGDAPTPDESFRDAFGKSAANSLAPKK